MKLCAVTLSTHDLLPLVFLPLNWCSIRTSLSSTSVALSYVPMCLSRSFVIVYEPSQHTGLSSDNTWG